MARVEDAALLAGHARFLDDLPVRTDTLHAAVVRSPHAHASVLSIEASAALALKGVAGVLTGNDVHKWSKPFVVGVKQPMEHWCLAMERVRYVGEPVAIVMAEDRYVAEDAAELIEVEYEPLPAVVDVLDATGPDAPILHPAVGSNVVSERCFRYGDVDAAFAEADHRIKSSITYPRNACTPIECLAAVVEYRAEDESYDVLSNFQGPFALQPVMALALKVSGAKLRLRSPAYSGGSFGVKQAVFPYIVALALASRKTGRPVKWVEDRLEHLTAATSATGRASTITAAVTGEGVITALDMEQFDDCGGYLRAPEPASLYRMHGNLSGAYGVRNIRLVNKVVLTNKTPSGLNRGFGGPQLYFAIERLVHKISVTLGIPHLEVIQRNLVPAGAFPYRTPSGGLLDSGDYPEAVRRAIEEGGLEELCQRQHTARAEGKFYGIGMTAAVEPSVSNMGYITTVLTPEERAKAGLKNGAQASASVALDPLGTVTVTAASVPQGQGHRTVLQQVVAAAFGLMPDQVVANLELDTQKDAWSIAAGNYSSRFAAAVAGAAHMAAMRLRDRLAAIAAPQLNVAAADVVFEAGEVMARGNPENALSFGRLAGTSHWSPGALPDDAEPALRETAFWSMPEHEAPNEKDEINSSGAYGFIFDFCGVEIDRATGRLTIDKYVTMHDAGRILHPEMVDGQIRGGFAHGLGAALLEEFQYAPDGAFLSGTFADYLAPTATEVPTPEIMHMQSPSPFTPLGAKGVGEGNCMSTPVCLANAVADALGVENIRLPMTPARIAELIHGDERPPRHSVVEPTEPDIHGDVTGRGERLIGVSREALWQAVLDPQVLAAVIPGCHELESRGENAYRGTVTMGVGPVRGRFEISFMLSDLHPPKALTLSGTAAGPLGASKGSGRVYLEPAPEGTCITYQFGVDVSGKVAAVGGRMIEGAAKIMIDQFFGRLGRHLSGDTAVESLSLLQRILRWLGRRP